MVEGWPPSVGPASSTSAMSSSSALTTSPAVTGAPAPVRLALVAVTDTPVLPEAPWRQHGPHSNGYRGATSQQARMEFWQGIDH